MKATCCLGFQTGFNQTNAPEMITMTDSLTSHVISHFMGQNENTKMPEFLNGCARLSPKYQNLSVDPMIRKSKNIGGYSRIRFIPGKTEGANKLNVPLLLYKMVFKRNMGKKNNPPFCISYFQLLPILIFVEGV